jgi:hypothetical protein
MNEKPNDGGAAFPSGPMGGEFHGEDGYVCHQWPGTCGMSLREYFAASSMQGLRASLGYQWESDMVAKMALADADALLKAMGK